MAGSRESQRYEDPALWSPSFWQGLEQDRQRAQLMLTALPAAAQHVLDVGCGNGVFTNLTREKTVIYGTDRSFAALRHVQPARCQASADALPFPSSYFDAVVCMEMLEHLPVDIYPVALAELVRTSSDAILLTVPYRENLRFSQITCPRCACEFHPYYHMRSFENNDLVHLFDVAQGIHVDKITGICPIQVRRFPGLWDQLRRRYHLGGANFPWYARCPQCEYSTKEAQPQSEKTHPQPAIKKSLRNLWPRTLRYQWWLAIYRKTG